MSETQAEGFERRKFLQGIAAAPLFFGAASAIPAVAIPALAAAETETGQTVRLAEYAAGLRYEQIPAFGTSKYRPRSCSALRIASRIQSPSFYLARSSRGAK
jgi:hypothetical protein